MNHDKLVMMNNAEQTPPGELSYPSELFVDDTIRIRPAADSDARTLSEWTSHPEVNAFWGGEEMTVEQVLEKYTGRRAPRVLSYIIETAGRAAGYVQAWQDSGKFGLDMFISASKQGQGIGPRAARTLALDLTSRGWTPLTVDPASNNERAIRAWAAAGFLATGEHGTHNGDTTTIMAFGQVGAEHQ